MQFFVFGRPQRHDKLAPVIPGQVCELEFSLTPLGHRFQAGSRVRLDISCTDSPITDSAFTHSLTPDAVGTDTLYHCPTLQSSLTLPVQLPDSVKWEIWTSAGS